MAKDLQWFKFECSEWLEGDIFYESYELQGMFITLCSMYWKRDCIMTEKDCEKRLPKVDLKALIKSDIIRIKNGYVIIKFLKEQWDQMQEKHRKLSEAGRRGGKASIKPPLKPPLSIREQEEEKDKENKKESGKIPSYVDFENYALKKRPSVNLNNLKNKYDAWVEAGWCDGKGKKISNWKSKILHNLKFIGDTEGRNKQEQLKHILR